jgi:ABC-2 type transport system ATP-binding protein
VTFKIEVDSITGRLGSNGAGKTTLMSLITGQAFPTSGAVRVFGQPPLENDRVLSQMCFVRESLRYPSNLRIGNVLAAGRHQQSSEPQLRLRACAVRHGLSPATDTDDLYPVV